VSYTLLLADDSVTIQRVIELTFADEDVRVVAVSDGDQAIERLESAPPDIVLADVGMPGRNGYEVARYVKQSPRLSHIPVVLLTGAFEPVDQARAAEVGCDGVLAKPFEPQLVIGRVKELLAGPARRLDAAHGGSSTPAGGSSTADLDEYFERLDVAFSNLQSGRPSGFGEPGPAPGREIEYYVSEDEPENAQEDELPAAVPPLAPPSPPPIAFEMPRAVGPERSAERAADMHLPPPTHRPTPHQPASHQFAPVPASKELVPTRSAPLPSIVDAFAAILAAEQHAPAPSARPAWPPSSPAAPNGLDPAVSEELVERIVSQVLDRLSDRILREQVSTIVSTVAERLVREEIERIKGSIK
jgi:CheY-like chemotaxis protein